MANYLYLSMIPESLVVSMLPPREFGTYLAVGTEKRARGQAMFFDLTGDLLGEYFDLTTAARHCVPHTDGQPKHSVYVAVYRVLEHVPLQAVNSLWLTTKDGRSLELKQQELPHEFPGRFHLYQEICPVHPLIASLLPPWEFCRFITGRGKPIFVPKICFVDLELSEWADDPRNGRARDLPYPHLEHVRDCLLQLEGDVKKPTKTIDRVYPQQSHYRCIKNGFFLGDGTAVQYYPFPSREDLESKYHHWWRSANV